MASGAERQARFKQQMRDHGFVQITIWIPPRDVPELHRVAELLRENRDLRIARLMNVKTGRLVGLNGPAKKRAKP
jgi:hypothetical protein